MDLYELINPSDPITFEASSPAVAGAQRRNANAGALCLRRSTTVCRMSDRKAMAAAVSSDAGAIERWNDVKRSSMNDFCGYARQVADALEAKGRERG